MNGDGDTTFDDLDRRIVAALQIDGRASWTDIAERCDTSVTTVARRAQHLLDTQVVRVAVVPDISSRGPADLFVVRIGCAPGAAKRVARQLMDRDDIRFLSIVTGSTDLVAELIAPKGDPFHHRLVEELPSIDGVQRCETDLVLHTYKVAHDWSRQLLDDAGNTVPAEPPHCEPRHFDDVDRAMIDVLRDDGRASFRTVAERIGVNESTARRRFETLRSCGCIHVVTLVPAAALGFESEMLLWITVQPSALEDVAHKLTAYRGMRYVGATLGGSLLMCELIMPSSDDVFSFVTTTLAQLDGVIGWTANMELLTVKRGFVQTPWSESLLVDELPPPTPLRPRRQVGAGSSA